MSAQDIQRFIFRLWIVCHERQVNAFPKTLVWLGVGERMESLGVTKRKSDTIGIYWESWRGMKCVSALVWEWVCVGGQKERESTAYSTFNELKTLGKRLLFFTLFSILPTSRVFGSYYSITGNPFGISWTTHTVANTCTPPFTILLIIIKEVRPA